MGELILPRVQQNEQNKAEVYNSLKPSFVDSMGDFGDAFMETPGGVGSAIKQNRLDEAGGIDVYSAGKGVYTKQAPIDIVDKETLNQKYGIPGELDFSKFDNDLNEAQAQIIRDQKMIDLTRQDLWNRMSGWGTAARVTTDFTAQMLDPVGLAVGLIFAPSKLLPVVKQLRPLVDNVGGVYTKNVASRMGAAAVTSSVDAAAGTAAMLPAYNYVSEQYGNDITMTENLLNITVGGLAGGALHSSLIGAGSLVSKSFNRITDIKGETPFFQQGQKNETVVQSLDTAVKQMSDGKPVEVRPLQEADPNLQQRNMLNSEAARLTKSGAIPLPETLRQDLAKLDHHGAPVKTLASKVDAEDYLQVMVVKNYPEYAKIEGASKVLADYQGSVGPYINRALAKGLELPDNYKDVIARLDQLSEISALKERVKLYRWQEGAVDGVDDIEQFTKSGYLFKNYVSTSLIPDSVQENPGKTLWEITAEPGTNAFVPSANRPPTDKASDLPFVNEAEVTLGRNTVMAIDSVTKRPDGTTVIQARTVPRDGQTLSSDKIKEMATNSQKPAPEAVYTPAEQKDLEMAAKDFYSTAKEIEIPTNEVIGKTKAMLAAEKEIASIEASLKESGFDIADDADILAANESVDHSIGISKALKQGWVCLTGGYNG
jgi:hypothetical protein